ncbi:unnamed protein product, partial [Ectocarpus sp. 13 AM-2016]
VGQVRLHVGAPLHDRPQEIESAGRDSRGRIRRPCRRASAFPDPSFHGNPRCCRRSTHRRRRRRRFARKSPEHRPLDLRPSAIEDNAGSKHRGELLARSAAAHQGDPAVLVLFLLLLVPVLRMVGGASLCAG